MDKLHEYFVDKRSHGISPVTDQEMDMVNDTVRDAVAEMFTKLHTLGIDLLVADIPYFTYLLLVPSKLANSTHDSIGTRQQGYIPAATPTILDPKSKDFLIPYQKTIMDGRIATDGKVFIEVVPFRRGNVKLLDTVDHMIYLARVIPMVIADPTTYNYLLLSKTEADKSFAPFSLSPATSSSSSSSSASASASSSSSSSKWDANLFVAEKEPYVSLQRELRSIGIDILEIKKGRICLFSRPRGYAVFSDLIGHNGNKRRAKFKSGSFSDEFVQTRFYDQGYNEANDLVLFHIAADAGYSIDDFARDIVTVLKDPSKVNDLLYYPLEHRSTWPLAPPSPPRTSTPRPPPPFIRSFPLFGGGGIFNPKLPKKPSVIKPVSTKLPLTSTTKKSYSRRKRRSRCSSRSKKRKSKSTRTRRRRYCTKEKCYTTISIRRRRRTRKSRRSTTRRRQC
jgi:hypothetical protein